MSASLIGWLGSSAFRPFHYCGVGTTRGLALLFGIGTEALPSWDSRIRWNDLWGGLAAVVGRSKRTCELTSSIVPRGTPFHRSVELEFPSIGFNPAPYSRHCGFPGPAELGAVNPDAVHDHGQPAGQSHDRLFHPAAPGNLHRPGLEPRRTQHALSCFVEHDPHHLIAAARYSAVPIDLAGLILGARQPKHRTHRLGFAEASRHVDGGAIGQRHHRADTGGRHQAPAYVIIPDHG